MITAANLREHTAKDLAQMARDEGVKSWHSMKKEQLVRALMRREKKRQAEREATKTTAKKSTAKAKKATARPLTAARKSTAKKTTAKKATAKKSTSRGTARRKSDSTRSKASTAKTAARKKRGTSRNSVKRLDAVPAPSRSTTNGRIGKRIRLAAEAKESLKDLSIINEKRKAVNSGAERDRVALMVRDPYWLHVYWEITRASVQRAKAAMAEQWHTAVPTIRVFELDDNGATSAAERVERDIEIHGGVSTWYIDVHNPPASYRVAIGYLASNGTFFTLVRSNSVTTPAPGSSDDIDQNWADLAENYEKVFAMSGGSPDEDADNDLQELFEERLHRPMGSPIVTRYGVGAEATLNRDRDFDFEVDAEMVVYGRTKPNAYVTLANEPVKLRPDGSFALRLSMPDRRQVLPIVASSGDGVEQRTTVLAIERNTKVMEPKIRDPNE